MACIDEIRDRLFRVARAQGRREASEAYAADALGELARRGGGGGAQGRPSGSRAKVIVRVDLVDTGDPFLAAVVTRGEQVVGVAHLGRRPSAAQQSALEWRYPTCAVEGCSATTWLENDHRVDWARSHLTVLELLDRLCSHHHDRKSLDGWALADGHGKRPFVAPDDPRHPRHAVAGPSAA